MFIVFRIMKVILSTMCTSLVGMLERGLGYHLEHRKNGFFSKRNQRGSVPPDGHWRFIVLCAELAQNGLYISDIKASQTEVMTALRESGRGDYLWKFNYPSYLHAADVLNLKSELGL